MHLHKLSKRVNDKNRSFFIQPIFNTDKIEEKDHREAVKKIAESKIASTLESDPYDLDVEVKKFESKETQEITASMPRCPPHTQEGCPPGATPRYGSRLYTCTCYRC